jgi:hypothetical protein
MSQRQLIMPREWSLTTVPFSDSVQSLRAHKQQAGEAARNTLRREQVFTKRKLTGLVFRPAQHSIAWLDPPQ